MLFVTGLLIFLSFYFLISGFTNKKADHKKLGWILMIAAFGASMISIMALNI